MFYFDVSSSLDPALSSMEYVMNSLFVKTHISAATFIALVATSSALIDSTDMSARAAATKIIHTQTKKQNKTKSNLVSFVETYNVHFVMRVRSVQTTDCID